MSLIIRVSGFFCERALPEFVFFGQNADDECVSALAEMIALEAFECPPSLSANLRIAQAYREARLLVATIPPDSGDARPQIIACFGIQIFTGRKMTLPVAAGY